MISRKKVLTYLAYSIIFLCVVNLLSIKGLWYYLIWWFDMPMHFLGGLMALFLTLYVFYGQISQKIYIPVGFLLLGVLGIGIGWELFEYVMLNIVAGQPFVITDTLSDICFDLAGGVLGLFLIRK